MSNKRNSLSDTDTRTLEVPLEEEYIEVFGARVHNLKNIDVRIPRDKLVVITGQRLRAAIPRRH